MSKLEEIEKRAIYGTDTEDGKVDVWLEIKDYELLIQQAERVEELENRNKELEYASKLNGKLNGFLQKRKLPPNTLGRHVVDVVMDYVEKLEKNNADGRFEHYKKLGDSL